jgi:hypothetical protein
MQARGTTSNFLCLKLSEELDQEETQLDLDLSLLNLVQLVFILFNLSGSIDQLGYEVSCEQL